MIVLFLMWLNESTSGVTQKLHSLRVIPIMFTVGEMMTQPTHQAYLRSNFQHMSMLITHMIKQPDVQLQELLFSLIKHPYGSCLNDRLYVKLPPTVVKWLQPALPPIYSSSIFILSECSDLSPTVLPTCLETTCPLFSVPQDPALP